MKTSQGRQECKRDTVFQRRDQKCKASPYVCITPCAEMIPILDTRDEGIIYLFVPVSFSFFIVASGKFKSYMWLSSHFLLDSIRP